MPLAQLDVGQGERRAVATHTNVVERTQSPRSSTPITAAIRERVLMRGHIGVGCLAERREGPGLFRALRAASGSDLSTTALRRAACFSTLGEADFE